MSDKVTSIDIQQIQSLDQSNMFFCECEHVCEDMSRQADNGR